jgi:hypothetical protein
MAPSKWFGVDARAFLVYIVVMLALVVPPALLLRQQQEQTRRFATNVCRAVNQNGAALTVEHQKTRAFLLLAYRARKASIATSQTPQQRRMNKRAAQLYLDLANSYKPFHPIICHVPE